MQSLAVPVSPTPGDSPAPPFERVWLQLQPRLLATLRRRGATRELAEDIAQEVALRCMARSVPYADVEDLLRWCNTAAHHLLVDHHRSARRIADIEPPDAVAVDDVFRTVEGRLALLATLRALHQLDDRDRSALIDALHEVRPAAGDRRESTMLAVRRNRARGRLRALLAGALSWLFSLLRGARRGVRAPGMTAAAALPVLLAVLPLTIGGSGGTPRAVVDLRMRSGASSSAVTASAPATRSLSEPRPAAHRAPSSPAGASAAKPGRLPETAVSAAGGRVGVRGRSKDQPNRPAPTVCVRPGVGISEACSPTHGALPGDAAPLDAGR